MKRLAIILVGLSITLALSESLKVKPPEKEKEPTSDWDLMVQALIIIESEGNPKAVGKTNDLGILQITPIYVKEVNRILGKDEYNLTDRLDVDKSLEMFEIYQAWHNSESDIKEAIKLHNPGAGSGYFDLVYKQYELLKEMNQA